MSGTELTKRASGSNERPDGSTVILSNQLSSVSRSEDDLTDAPVLSREEVTGVYLVILSAIIDIAGVAMVVPILPYYAESFGANATQLGFLYSAFSASAGAATLFMGTLSDYIGRRAVIIISLFGSFSGFLFHGFSQNYNQLLAARVYTGFFSSSMTIAQAYIADVVPGPQQPKYMANLGAAIGFTFMVVPTIGGAVTAAANNDYSMPYFVSAAIAGLGMLFAFFKLKDPKKKDDDDAVAAGSDAEGKSNNLTKDEEVVHEMLKSRLFGFPRVIYFLGLVRFCCQTGWAAQTSMFALFTMEKYGISAVYLSTMMMVGAVCYVISTVTLFKYLVVKIGLVYTLSIGMMTMATALILYSAPGSDGISNTWLTFVISWICYVGFSLYMPSITSLFAKFTTPGERGKILGCGSVFHYSADIVGPIVFGILYQQDKNLMWYAAGGSLIFGLLMLMPIYVFTVRKKKRVRKMLDAKLDSEDKPTKEDWLLEKDKPYTDEDYLKLGKRLGDILSNKNWRWVKKMDVVEKVIETSFPRIPEEVFTNKQMWDNYWNYLRTIWGEMKLLQSSCREDYVLAEKHGWDFSMVEHEPVDFLHNAFGK